MFPMPGCPDARMPGCPGTVSDGTLMRMWYWLIGDCMLTRRNAVAGDGAHFKLKKLAGLLQARLKTRCSVF